MEEEEEEEEGMTGAQQFSADTIVAHTEPPNTTVADPGPDSASAGAASSTTGRAPYIPQFSAATQMILQRINGKSAGGLSSALSSASAVAAKSIEQSTYEDARRRLVMNMNTSLTMPLPTPKAPQPALNYPAVLPAPAGSLPPIDDDFQLRTPSVAKPGTAAAAAAAKRSATKAPAKRGRPPKAGTKRKRSQEDDAVAEDTSSLSDAPPNGDAAATAEGPAAKSRAPPKTTKSGRAVQKPAPFHPASTHQQQHRKQQQQPTPHHGGGSKRTPPDQALCKVCTRGLSPQQNQIVFCDGCNACWHQLCHEPYIDDDFVRDESRSWFCHRCLAKRERHLAKKRTLDGFKGVSWAAKNADQVRPRLSSLGAMMMMMMVIC